jgi:microcin C transport system ATP-binding protein
MTLLQVDHLSVTFGHGDREFAAVKDISFSVDRGETVALVGESGSGKSVTALSILKLLPYPQAWHPSGGIKFEGQEIIDAPQSIIQKIRGNRISMIFQEPMTSLNPLHTIGRQIGEVLLVHKNMTSLQARKRIIDLLNLVALPEPEKRLQAYPHELSGGQRQRVMIAMALANDPDLLIADEPTTALDVTIQAQILTLLKDLQKRLGMALLLITHDLGIVRKVADKVCVMQSGRLVEQAPTDKIFSNPQHTYTQMLLAAEPKGEAFLLDPKAKEILNVTDLKVYFPIKKSFLGKVTESIRAVDGISLSLRTGETVGIVGESGSGKTTLGLALLRLIKAKGTVIFMGQSVLEISRSQMRALRRSMQIVFQDPFGSLSPRMSAGDIIAEGLDLNKLCSSKDERESKIIAAMKEVGLDPGTRNRYPHEFSGGQRQRISIARALILEPEFIVLDEPTSALDMSVQAQIVELLRDLQQRHSIAFLFISHDLRVVRALAHRVLVMKNGQCVEYGDAAQLFAHPQKDYTKALLAAALNLEARA